MLHVLLAALALASLTFVVSGCGDSSKTQSTNTVATTTATTATAPATTAAITTAEPITIKTGKSLSRKAWITKGDAICDRANVKLNSTILRREQDFARVLPQAANYDRVEAIELSKLVPPAAMAADWQQVVSGLQKFGEYTAKAAEAVQTTHKINAATAIFEVANNAQKRLTAIAKRDGFKVCSIP